MLLEQHELMHGSSATNNFHMQSATQQRSRTANQEVEETEIESNQRVAYQQFAQSSSSHPMSSHSASQHHQQQSTSSSNNNTNLYQHQHQIYNELMLSQNLNSSHSSSIMNYPSAYMDYNISNSSEMMSNKYYSHSANISTSSGQYQNSSSHSNGTMYSNHHHQHLYDQFYNQQKQHQYASMSHFMPSNKQYNNYSNSSNFFDSTNAGLSSDSQSTCGFCSAVDFVPTHSHLGNYQCNSGPGQLNSNPLNYHYQAHYHQPLEQHQQQPCDTPPPITNKMTTTTASIDGPLSDEYHSSLYNHSYYHNTSTLSELNQQTTSQSNTKNIYPPASILDALNQSNLYHVANSQQTFNSSYDMNNNRTMNGNDLHGECNQDFRNETLINESSGKMNVDSKEIDYYSGKENLIQSSSSPSVSSGLSSSANSPESLSNFSTYSSCSYNPSQLNNLLVSKNSAFQYYAKNLRAYHSNNQKDKLNSNKRNYQRIMKLGQSLSEYDMRFTDSKAKEWCISSHPRLSNTLLNSNSTNQSIMNMLDSPFTSSPSPVFNSAIFCQDESNNPSPYSNYNINSMSCNPANMNQISTSNTMPNLSSAKKQANNITMSYSMNDSVRYQIEQQQFNDTSSLNNISSNSNF